jgi:ABC-type transport system involved in multi-copper enzyme maturation permease subunit
MLRELRFYMWGGLAYCVVLELLLVGAIVFWPDFEENIDAVRSMMPVEFLQNAVDLIGEGGAPVYVLGQHFFKGCNTVGVLAAIVFAMGTIAGEAHRGTLEVWLARPLSRRRLLSERWIAGALAVCAPVFLTTLTIPWLLGMVQEEISLQTLLLAATHQSLFLLALYSVTCLYSAFSSQPVQIAFTMLLLVIAEFAMYIIQKVTHYSLFRLVDFEVLIGIGARGTLDWQICAPLIAVSIVALIATERVFAKRVP